MAKWNVSEEMDDQGRRNLTVQKGRKKIAVKMSEGDADKLIRYILRRFDD